MDSLVFLYLTERIASISIGSSPVQVFFRETIVTIV